MQTNCSNARKLANPGFTMIELMMVVAITAIIATLTVPSIRQAIENAEVRADAHTLQTFLVFARHYAVANYVTVQICQRSDSMTPMCENNYSRGRSWHNGWLVFADLNQNNHAESDEVLKIKGTLNNTSIHFNQSGRIRFFSDGSARSAGFYVCSRGASIQRYLSLLHSGRVRIKDKLPSRARRLCETT